MVDLESRRSGPGPRPRRDFKKRVSKYRINKLQFEVGVQPTVCESGKEKFIEIKKH